MSIEEEFLGANLGDERLNNRLLSLANSFEKRHGEGILTVCDDWKSCKAAYRFFDNQRFSENDIISPHYQQTKNRVSKSAGMTLVLHDSTEFNYTHHEKTEGLGYLSSYDNGKRGKLWFTEGFLMHSSMAITPEGVPLGLLSQKQWCRDRKNFRKIKESKLNSTAIKIEEKESYKWIEGINNSTKGLKADKLIHVCDREADIYELFDSCRSLGSHFVVRGVHSRGTSHSGVKSFSRLCRISSQGKYQLEIKSSQKRKARIANIQVRFYKVKLIPPAAKSKEYSPIELYVVSARERIGGKTPDKEKVNWKLLTDLPVESFDQALEIISHYQARWNIEDYFKILKSGFGAEKSRLRHVDRLKKFVSLVSIIAWRVFWLTKVSRQKIKLKPQVAFSKEEIVALKQIEKKKQRSLKQDDGLHTYVIAVARLGGYLARKSDPPPGNLVLWRGLRRLNDILMIYDN